MRFALLALLLPLPALAGGGDDAEKLFRELEKKVLAAKSLHLASEIEMVVKDEKGKFKGTLDLMGKKARFKMTGPFVKKRGAVDGEAMTMEAVSDGMKLVATITPPGKSTTKPTPKTFHELLCKMVCRAGVSGTLFIIEPAGPGPEKEADPDQVFKVSDFKAGKATKVNGRAARVLHYRVTLPGQEPLDVTLWLDAKTLLPLKRVFAKTGMRPALTETHTEFKLNPKLGAKTFELPK
jgi:outer membrane lipoprotein-sorting protein